MSVTLVHKLLAVPLPHTVCAGQCPSSAQVQCLLSPGQIFQAQIVNNGREETTTEQKNAPPLPTSKRRKKMNDEEKQCKKKELDRAREKTRVNNRASFQRWRELQDL